MGQTDFLKMTNAILEVLQSLFPSITKIELTPKPSSFTKKHFFMRYMKENNEKIIDVIQWYICPGWSPHRLNGCWSSIEIIFDSIEFSSFCSSFLSAFDRPVLFTACSMTQRILAPSFPIKTSCFFGHHVNVSMMKRTRKSLPNGVALMKPLKIQWHRSTNSKANHLKCTKYLESKKKATNKMK